MGLKTSYIQETRLSSSSFPSRIFWSLVMDVAGMPHTYSSHELSITPSEQPRALPRRQMDR